MKIDFKELALEQIVNFKGGEGRLDMRAYVDKDTRLMYCELHPGASSGKHPHCGTFEAIYVLHGELTAYCDDIEERICEGELHYCPEGHTHWYENKSDGKVAFFAIVPTLKK
ncbi:MAG: cupin domain-containing protein [Prevotella sp.]|nr:cupin domain-containing protein [Prevotella sp.]MDY4217955.1 cupin domain-containing protein [Prevotella sp.]